MLGLVEDFAKTIATFGIVTAPGAATEMVLFGSDFTTDDPWIFGALVGSIVALVALVLRVCERLVSRPAALWTFAGIYSAFAVYTAYVFATAELFGPGVSVIVFVSSLVLNTLDLLLSRRVSAFYHVAVGLLVAVLLAGFFLLV